MCFVSHCGVNSTIEGILAGVPILVSRTWYSVGPSLTRNRAAVDDGTKFSSRPKCRSTDWVSN